MAEPAETSVPSRFAALILPTAAVELVSVGMRHRTAAEDASPVTAVATHLEPRSIGPHCRTSTRRHTHKHSRTAFRRVEILHSISTYYYYRIFFNVVHKLAHSDAFDLYAAKKGIVGLPHDRASHRHAQRIREYLAYYTTASRTIPLQSIV